MTAWAVEFGINPETFRTRAVRRGVQPKARRFGGLVLLTRREAEKCRPPGWSRETAPARHSASSAVIDWSRIGAPRSGKPAKAKAASNFDWLRFDHVMRRTRSKEDIPRRYDWRRVDWRMKDIEIAERLGCSDAAVSKKRRELGKPKASSHGRKRWLMAANARIDAALRAADEHTSDRTLAKQLKVNERHVGRRRHILGIPAVIPRPSIWSSLIDWRLVNQDIKAIWKVKTVGTFREYHAGKVRPMFTYGTGAKGEVERYRKRMENRRYLAIHRAQRKLAKRRNRIANTYQRY